MRAKRYKWYWVEHWDKKNKKRSYSGPAYCYSGMHKYSYEPSLTGFFKLPSGATGVEFHEEDVLRELDKEWVEKNYPSYEALWEFWKTPF